MRAKHVKQGINIFNLLCVVRS